jgi:hypothetical protein
MYLKLIYRKKRSILNLSILMHSTQNIKQHEEKKKMINCNKKNEMINTLNLSNY